MGITIDSKLFSTIFTRTNVLRVVAVGLAGSGAIAAFSLSGKASGPVGININDMLNTAVPVALSVVAWLGANWSKVSPEFIQAGLALVKSPKDPAAWIRLITALIVFGKQAMPDSKVISILVQASQAMHTELLLGSTDNREKQAAIVVPASPSAG